jgi:hypothetical protein
VDEISVQGQRSFVPHPETLAGDGFAYAGKGSREPLEAVRDQASREAWSSYGDCPASFVGDEGEQAENLRQNSDESSPESKRTDAEGGQTGKGRQNFGDPPLHEVRETNDNNVNNSSPHEDQGSLNFGTGCRNYCPACFGGYVTMTSEAEEDGEEHDEAVPCRRCAS